MEDVGDNSLRRYIVYILRLEAGQRLTATMLSPFVKGQDPGTIALSLIDGRTTSFDDDAVNVLGHRLGAIDRTRSPAMIQASIAYVAPITADYYLIATFQANGIEFTLSAKVETAITIKRPSTCVTGLVASTSYLSPGVSDSLLSDVTVGDPAKVDHPDEYNRHFCLKSACNIRPPTSLVLTIKLQGAFDAKKQIRACWDSSNVITEVAFSP